jgi:hypothetical protein
MTACNTFSSKTPALRPALAASRQTGPLPNSSGTLAAFLTMWEQGWRFDAWKWLPAFKEEYDQGLAVPGNHDYQGSVDCSGAGHEGGPLLDHP